ncbi:MAG: hypothetical protein ACRC6U_00990 [Fusobacteriaceae bacterium]
MKFIKIERGVEGEILELEIVNMNTELDYSLKREIVDMIEAEEYTYHFLYSYVIDTTDIDVIHNEYSIYIGEGDGRRVFEVKRNFNENICYQELLERNAIITKKINRIYRTKDVAVDLKTIAKADEKKLITQMEPLFNKMHNNSYWINKAVVGDKLYTTVKENEIKKVSSGIRGLQEEDVRRDSLMRMIADPSLSVKGYNVKTNKELNAEEKVKVGMLILDSRKLDWKTILEYYNVDTAELFREL